MIVYGCCSTLGRITAIFVKESFMGRCEVFNVMAGLFLFSIGLITLLTEHDGTALLFLTPFSIGVGLSKENLFSTTE